MYRKYESSRIKTEEEAFSSKRCLEWFYEYAGRKWPVSCKTNPWGNLRRDALGEHLRTEDRTLKHVLFTLCVSVYVCMRWGGRGCGGRRGREEERDRVGANH